MSKKIFTLAKYVILLFIAIGAVVVVFVENRRPEIIRDVFNQKSVVSKVVPQGQIKSTDGRTNFLILGLDARSADNKNVKSTLTDTIIVVSVSSDGSDPVIISIPRDLWIKQTKSKINAIYALTDDDPQEVVNAVEMVVGIPIHYYVVVGFNIFEDVINTIGGIDIYVPEGFEDFRYPIENKENAYPISSRYEHIKFSSGWQKMDAETALKYARSRHSTIPNQAGDFARARRQQQVLTAIKDKILSTKMLFNPDTVKNLYEDYRKNIKTNVSFSEVILLVNKYRDFEIGTVKSIVLSSEPRNPAKPGSGTLVVPDKKEREERYGGQYVLVPASGTFDFIHALVREALFE